MYYDEYDYKNKEYFKNLTFYYVYIFFVDFYVVFAIFTFFFLTFYRSQKVLTDKKDKLFDCFWSAL